MCRIFCYNRLFYYYLWIKYSQSNSKFFKVLRNDKMEVKMQDNKGLDFKHKEVINIKDARRLGYVQDVCADLETGRITAIIVPGGTNKIANFFSSVNDIVIKWEDIRSIGDDLILVEIWKKFTKHLILPKNRDILLNVEKTHKGSMNGSAEEVLKCVELYGS